MRRKYFTTHSMKSVLPCHQNQRTYNNRPVVHMERNANKQKTLLNPNKSNSATKQKEKKEINYTT